jgi:hypothetical protein
MGGAQSAGAGEMTDSDDLSAFRSIAKGITIGLLMCLAMATVYFMWGS